MRGVIDYLKMNDVEYKENLSFKELTTIRLGGSAAVVAYPESVCELIKLVRFLEKTNIKFKIIGNMSNILPPSGLYNGVIIKTARLNSIYTEGEVVISECGITLPLLAHKLAPLGIGGLENLSGIPATIGGAVVGNAGAFGGEISDFVRFVTVYSHSQDKIITLTKEQLEFSYRSSILKKSQYTVLTVALSLYNTDPYESKRKISEYREERCRTQPYEYPSLGSVFKRPIGHYAARLIDSLGLKGYIVGGAQVSEKHAGFILNKSNATPEDVKELVLYIQERVRTEFGISLEKEIEYLE